MPVSLSPASGDDPSGSQDILKKRTIIEKMLQSWDSLNRQADDVRVMIELGEEAADEATLPEVHEMNERLKTGVEEAEFQRMLSGTHDRNGCFVSVNSGAGGTESPGLG